jgi:hypothetical protein
MIKYLSIFPWSAKVDLCQIKKKECDLLTFVLCNVGVGLNTKMVLTLKVLKNAPNLP